MNGGRPSSTKTTSGFGGQIFTEEDNAKQAAELWSMLDLTPGCHVLDAPCGWGRLSRPLALLGATVLGIRSVGDSAGPRDTRSRGFA